MIRSAARWMDRRCWMDRPRLARRTCEIPCTHAVCGETANIATGADTGGLNLDIRDTIARMHALTYESGPRWKSEPRHPANVRNVTSNAETSRDRSSGKAVTGFSCAQHGRTEATMSHETVMGVMWHRRIHENAISSRRTGTCRNRRQNVKSGDVHARLSGALARATQRWRGISWTSLGQCRKRATVAPRGPAAHAKTGTERSRTRNAQPTRFNAFATLRPATLPGTRRTTTPL